MHWPDSLLTVIVADGDLIVSNLFFAMQTTVTDFFNDCNFNVETPSDESLFVFVTVVSFSFQLE